MHIIRIFSFLLILAFWSNAAEAQFNIFKKKNTVEETETAIDPVLERSLAFLADNASQEGVVVLESGLQYKIMESAQSKGRTPFRADIVIVHYEGSLADGTVFDTTFERGQPANFNVAQVIKGWTEGLMLMQEGDKYRLFVPPELAYGERGFGANIGPNEALVFDVELIEVIRTGLAQ